jgi:hypothetical protein
LPSGAINGFNYINGKKFRTVIPDAPANFTPLQVCAENPIKIAAQIKLTELCCKRLWLDW